MDQKIFSQRLAEMRTRRGLSKAALARRVGITDVYLGDLEIRGKTPSLTVAGKLADALGVTVGWLCGRDAPSPETTSANEDRELAEPDPARHNGPTGPDEAGKGGSGAMSTTGASVDPWVLLDRLTRAHENYSEAAKIHAEAHMEEARTHRLREENIAKQTAVAPPADEIPHFPSRATGTAAERAE